MALATAVDANKRTPSPQLLQTTRDASITSQWFNVLSAGGPATEDNGGSRITLPETQIDNASTIPIGKTTAGTVLMLRLAYDDALSAITNPVIQVFGRTVDPGGDSQEWQLLKSNDSVEEVAIVTNATGDVSDGTLKYTTPDLVLNTWDMLGCSEIRIGVKTALSGTGVTANSILQAKIVN